MLKSPLVLALLGIVLGIGTTAGVIIMTTRTRSSAESGEARPLAAHARECAPRLDLLDRRDQQAFQRPQGRARGLDESKRTRRI